MPETASACLTAREAAAFLHLNEKKLYELANSREIPAARIGGKWLFPRALLEDWLLEQAHGGALTDRLLITGSDDPLLAATTAALAGRRPRNTRALTIAACGARDSTIPATLVP